MDFLVAVVSFLSNAFTIVASTIAIYLFFFKKDQIKAVFNLLANYSTQLSLRELTSKLEQINDLKVAEQRDEIINIFHEIIGQIRGNPQLARHLIVELEKLEKSVSGRKQITEPIKRSLVSEVREKLRHINLITFDNMAGE